jgi:FtsH-binding integral membrane protein
MTIVSQASSQDRQQFIQKTYLHLAGAVALFIAIEFVLFITPAAEAIYSLIVRLPFSWLAVLGCWAGWQDKWLLELALFKRNI